MRPVLCNLLFCDKITAGRGKFNLEGIFYRVHAEGYPCRHRCYVVVGWCGESGSYTFGMRFLTPDRKECLFEIPQYHFKLSQSSPYYNGVIEVYLPLGREGVYWFEVYLNGESAAFFPLHVETVQAGGMYPPA